MIRWAAIVISAVFACMLQLRSAWSWDTCVLPGVQHEWASVYWRLGDCPSETSREHSRNEHPEIADTALKKLLSGGLFGFDSGVEHTIVDLNASLFRAEFLGDTIKRQREPLLDPLETRELPAPAHFAGLPDYAYTVYDWINKGKTCVPLPGAPLADENCHKLIGWLGAINSSHFGTQAAANFNRLHGIALDIARRAAEMREKLVAADSDGRHIAAYELFLKEAELMALTYEGVAQHFLQDRWAAGHMWERWGAGSVGELQGNYPSALVVGGITGLIHGSEAVMGYPDMLSSPEIVDTPSGKVAKPARLRKGTAEPFEGVGDYRLRDMLRGFFGDDYRKPMIAPAAPALPSHGPIATLMPLTVDKHRDQMFRCVKASWAEVIRAFGSYKGGYGVHQAKFTEDPGPLEDCFNAWVVNESFKRAAVDDPVLKVALNGRVAIDVVLIGAAIVATLATGGTGGALVAASMSYGMNSHGYSSREITRLLETISLAATADPDGTSLARGGLGSFNGFSPGNAFRESKFLEPLNLDDLPYEDDAGRDKRSVHGFFNRALTTYWCTHLGIELEKLRGKDRDSVEAAACAYLADRAYGGTHPGYEGAQAERRTTDGKKGSPEIKPICEALGLSGTFKSDYTPIQLRPGYVSRERGPYARGRSDIASVSIQNWCAKVPVLDLMGGDKPSREDLVAEVKDRDETVVITGVDLGNEPGELVLWAGGDVVHTLKEFVSWSDREIRFKLPKNQHFSESDYNVIVRTASIDYQYKSSVGRFVLRLKDPWVGLWARGETRIRIARDGNTLKGRLEKVAPASRDQRDFREGMDVLEGTVTGYLRANMKMLAHYDKEWRERCEAARAGYLSEGEYRIERPDNMTGKWENRAFDQECRRADTKIEDDHLVRVEEGPAAGTSTK